MLKIYQTVNELINKTGIIDENACQLGNINISCREVSFSIQDLIKPLLQVSLWPDERI